MVVDFRRMITNIRSLYSVETRLNQFKTDRSKRHHIEPTNVRDNLDGLLDLKRTSHKKFTYIIPNENLRASKLVKIVHWLR